MRFYNAPMTHRRAIWPWFVIATTVIIGGAPWLPAPYNVDKLVLPAVGGLWALAFYLHSRHSEDARFAKELLTDFNERYDKQNDDLQRALLKAGPLDQEEELKFIDYFNLCAEEWLFRELGYIYEPIWEAWSSGMRQYSSDKRVIALWQEERKSKSYYGFEFPGPETPNKR